jgi:predicted Zn-dependent protease
MDYCKKLGADYADIRVKDIRTQSLAAEDGKMKV